MTNFKLFQNAFHYLVLGLLVLIETQAFGQIKGRVIDAKTQSGISQCNVYLAGYTVGTITDQNGNFTLENIPNGVYELVFSHVSYKNHIEILQYDEQSIQLKVQLAEDIQNLDSFVLRNNRGLTRRKRDLKKFKSFFFGSEYNENLINITNEGIIDFKKEQGIMTTDKDYSLFIENQYLGYDINYYLKDFLYSESTKIVLGFPSFSKMTSEDPSTEIFWIENRQKAYNGSLRHFFKALLDKNLKKAGFDLYLTRKDPEITDESADKFYESQNKRKLIDAQNLPINFTIEDTDISNIKRINFGEVLDINYRNEYAKDGGFQNSKIKLIDPYVYVYNNGVVINPSAFKIYGQMADEGIYHLLPYEFESNDTLILKENQERVQILNQISELSNVKPTEKLYIHTNRNDYKPGETIWFKSYAVAGPNHQPSPISMKTYVELIHADSVYRSIILEAEQGASAGSLYIPYDAPLGKYVLRGYTNWMKNESTEYFFKKSIIVNNEETYYEPSEITDQVENLNLVFFPESGNLFNGQSQKIAFRATSVSGLPVPTEGEIRTKQGQVITKFKSSHDGMGIIEMTPRPNQEYSAFLKGFDVPFEFPNDRTNYLMSIDAINDSTNIQITVRNNQKKNENLFIIAQCRGWLNYTTQFNLMSGKKSINIPKSILNEGIIHITLFDKKARPLAERLIYNEKSERLFISLSSSQNNYQPRDQTTIDIVVTDQKGNPVSGSFSASVINQESIRTTPEDRSIATELLISSDLKGFINKPAYYLNMDNSERLKHLDLLMMTHDWTRTDWETLENQINDVYTYPADEGIDLSGRMLVRGKDKPVKKGAVTYISNKEDNPQTSVVTTDQKGRFLFKAVNPRSSDPILLKGLTNKGKKEVSFEIDSFMDYPSINAHEMLPFLNNYQVSTSSEESPAYYQTNLELLELNAELNDRDISSTPNLKEARQSIYGQPTSSYPFIELTQDNKQGYVFNYMEGRIPGIQMTPDGPVIRGTKTNPFSDFSSSNVTVSDSLNSNDNLGSPIFDDSNLPLLFLDNVKVDYLGVSSLPVEIVERVDIYKGPDAIIFGTGSAAGAIMIFTRMDMEDRIAEFNGTYRLKVKGFHQPRDFYQPPYDKTSLEFAPDHRKSIYWTPNIVTDERGRASFTFRNSDDLSDVLIRIEGLSSTGTPGIATYYYKMKAPQVNE